MLFTQIIFHKDQTDVIIGAIYKAHPCNMCESTNPAKRVYNCGILEVFLHSRRKQNNLKCIKAILNTH